MEVEKNSLFLMLGMSVVLLLLPINSLLSMIYESNLIYWTIFGLMLVLIIVSITIYYKMRDKKVIISKKLFDFNKYILYVYLGLYIVYSLTNKDTLSSKILILNISLTISAFISLINNIILFFKSFKN